MIFGEEKYLVRNHEDELRASIIEPGMEMMNLDTFEGKAIPAEDIINAAMQMPFLSDRRLVVVKGSGLFAAGRKDDSEKMAGFLGEPESESAAMIFIEDNVDKRGRLYKKLAELGKAIECKTPPEKEMSDWVMKWADKKITKDIAVSLIRYVSHGMENVYNELKKLLDYAGESDKRRRISFEDIQRICTPSLENRVFDLVDAVGGKNAGKALDIFSNLLIMKEQPLMILGMIARQFRLMLLCGYLSEQGCMENEIADRLSLRDFMVRNYLKQSGNFTRDKLLNGLEDCLALDIDVKTGRIDDKTGIEVFIMKYAGI